MENKSPLLVLVALFLILPPSAWASPPADIRVNPAWVKARLDDPAWLITSVSWGTQAYAKGHIPSAIHVNTDEIEYDLFPPRKGTAPEKLGRTTTAVQDAAKGISPAQSLPRNFWRLYPDAYLLPALAHMGITRNSRVIVTGPDLLAASRFAWTLLYAGVADVRLLDGGERAWARKGYPLESLPVPRSPKTEFGSPKALNPHYKASIEQINNKAELLDVRTRGEFHGIWAPYDYIPTKGRIPGAIWIGSGSSPWDVNDYLNEDGKIKSPGALARLWKRRGARGNHTIFYCGTGWRASVSFILARAAGWQNIQNLDGGWMVWSMGNK